MADASRLPGQATEKVESMGTAAGQMAEQAKEEAKQAVSGVAERAQQAAASVAHRTQEIAANVAQRAQDAAATAAEKTDEAISTVGQKVTALAEAMREKAPHEGAIGSAASAVASRLEAGGHYLEEHGLGDMADDVAAVIRRYPLQAVLLGLGLGVLVGCALSRR